MSRTQNGQAASTALNRQHEHLQQQQEHHFRRQTASSGTLQSSSAYSSSSALHISSDCPSELPSFNVNNFKNLRQMTTPGATARYQKSIYKRNDTLYDPSVKQKEDHSGQHQLVEVLNHHRSDNNTTTTTSTLSSSLEHFPNNSHNNNTTSSSAAVPEIESSTQSELIDLTQASQEETLLADFGSNSEPVQKPLTDTSPSLPASSEHTTSDRGSSSELHTANKTLENNTSTTSSSTAVNPTPTPSAATDTSAGNIISIPDSQDFSQGSDCCLIYSTQRSHMESPSKQSSMQNDASMDYAAHSLELDTLDPFEDDDDTIFSTSQRSTSHGNDPTSHHNMDEFNFARPSQRSGQQAGNTVNDASATQSSHCSDSSASTQQTVVSLLDDDEDDDDTLLSPPTYNSHHCSDAAAAFTSHHFQSPTETTRTEPPQSDTVGSFSVNRSIDSHVPFTAQQSTPAPTHGNSVRKRKREQSVECLTPRNLFNRNNSSSVTSNMTTTTSPISRRPMQLTSPSSSATNEEDEYNAMLKGIQDHIAGSSGCRQSFFFSRDFGSHSSRSASSTPRVTKRPRTDGELNNGTRNSFDSNSPSQRILTPPLPSSQNLSQRSGHSHNSVATSSRHSAPQRSLTPALPGRTQSVASHTTNTPPPALRTLTPPLRQSRTDESSSSSLALRTITPPLRRSGTDDSSSNSSSALRTLTPPLRSSSQNVTNAANAETSLHSTTPALHSPQSTTTSSSSSSSSANTQNSNRHQIHSFQPFKYQRRYTIPRSVFELFEKAIGNVHTIRILSKQERNRREHKEFCESLDDMKRKNIRLCHKPALPALVFRNRDFYRRTESRGGPYTPHDPEDKRSTQFIDLFWNYVQEKFADINSNWFTYFSELKYDNCLEKKGLYVLVTSTKHDTYIYVGKTRRSFFKRLYGDNQGTNDHKFILTDPYCFGQEKPPQLIHFHTLTKGTRIWAWLMGSVKNESLLDVLENLVILWAFEFSLASEDSLPSIGMRNVHVCNIDIKGVRNFKDAFFIASDSTVIPDQLSENLVRQIRERDDCYAKRNPNHPVLEIVFRNRRHEKLQIQVVDTFWSSLEDGFQYPVGDLGTKRDYSSPNEGPFAIKVAHLGDRSEECWVRVRRK